ncbi:MAG: glycosyltransferase family 2 protein [Armatimonadota bacterium]
MDISVIFTTYNSPDWLEKAVWGWYAQTDRDFELIVADDGSTDETRERIDSLRDATGMQIKHIWQEDRGFRKTRILNKAVQIGREYQVFSDGDCIPRADFVATHRQYARPGRFLSGGYFKLPQDVSDAITREDILEQRPFDLAWLRSHGVRPNLHALKFLGGPVARVLNNITTTKATWNGHSASGWKSDLLAVNGFDEQMTYGGEDREMGYRLVNNGVRPYRIRYSTICVHLAHGRSYATDEVKATNRAIMDRTLQTGRKWTPHGIANETEAATPSGG